MQRTGPSRVSRVAHACKACTLTCFLTSLIMVDCARMLMETRVGRFITESPNGHALRLALYAHVSIEIIRAAVLELVEQLGPKTRPTILVVDLRKVHSFHPA